MAAVMPIIVEQYPFYAPMIALYTLGLRYCHVADTVPIAGT
jgi:hypothetical protein